MNKYYYELHEGMVSTSMKAHLYCMNEGNIPKIDRAGVYFYISGTEYYRTEGLLLFSGGRYIL